MIFSCFGDRAVGAPTFTLTGSRTSISADGTESTYQLRGTVNAAGNSIAIVVDGTFNNAEGIFDGTAHLDGPCDKNWRFQTERQ